MGHYMLNFLFTTGGLIILLYLVYLYIKQNPQLGGIGNLMPQKSQGEGLKVISAIGLEPRKRLYVVGYGKQRFLVSTTMEKTELLATLEPEEEFPIIDTQAMQTDANMGGKSASGEPLLNGFTERFKHSLKLVFADRFNRLGGR